jgi:hypothetical protein
MDYLVFDTKEEAEVRSRQAWEDVLGRPKKPEDVTEFLWPVILHADGRASLELDELSAEWTVYLTPEETASLISEPPPPLEEM